MKSFIEYITEAAKKGKNVHMRHLEDSVIYGGVKGTREAIFALRALRDMLAGKVSSSSNVTVKWDGAPAVFAGVDPTDGQFFVAKKGIFNVEPKVYKSEADVRADTSGDLADKLVIAFNELKDLGIKDVIQGDIMFTKGDLSSESIDGEKYVTFQPNTIVYAVPASSDLAKTLLKSNIGVVWHTTYKGKDFHSMSASYGVNMKSLKKKSTVWSIDADLPKDLSGTATLTQADTEEVTQQLSRAGKIFNKIKSTTLNELENNTALAIKIETFNNTLVRKGERIQSTAKHVNDLIAWFNNKYAKEYEKRKSEKGKLAILTKQEEEMKFFSKDNRKNLDFMFQLQNALVDAKLIIIEKLDKLKTIGTFVRTKNGFKVTGSEGFVAIDNEGGAVKLVDRLEFSTNNFSPEILKGWSLKK